MVTACSTACATPGSCPPIAGKGFACWIAYGLVLAEARCHVMAVHDCDITTYDRELLARLCYPVVHPSLGFEFAKGYYARVTDRMNGRVTRLFMTPLLRSLQVVVGRQPLLVYLDSFRYALAGEFAMKADLARVNRIPSDWGLEVGMLAEVVPELRAEAHLPDRALRATTTTSTRPSRRTTRPKGLTRMCTDIAQNVIRTLAAEGIVFTEGVFQTLLVQYIRMAAGHDHALSRRRRDQRPGLRPPRRGDAWSAVFSEALRTAYQRFLEDPLGAPLIPNWNRIAAAIPGLPRPPARRGRRGLRRARRAVSGERCTAMPLLIVTDLDGTLLDPVTYDARAGPGRARTGRARRHPARAVLEQDPRGDRGAAAAPRASTTRSSPRTAARSSRRSATSHRRPARRRRRRRPVRARARPAVPRRSSPACARSPPPNACSVVGFSDMTVGDVAAECGLSVLDAQLAKLREYDEPFRLLDADPAARSRFLKALHRRGLRAVSGGRFDHVTGDADKGRAVAALRALCRTASGPVVMAGLGDGLNDVSMLREVDLPVIVRSDMNGATGRLLRKVPTARVTERERPGGLGRGGHGPARRLARAAGSRRGRDRGWGGHERAPTILAPGGPRTASPEIGQADIVVGIPSYQNAATIGHVVQAAQTGLAKYFPGRAVRRPELRRRVDGRHAGDRGGDDRRPTRPSCWCRNPVRPIHRFTRAVPRRSRARAARSGRSSGPPTCSGARACAVVDADLRSITPGVDPPARSRRSSSRAFDYVAPYYLRHKFDGTITNNVVYPLTRALYGKRIRQPIGGDFGMSRAARSSTTCASRSGRPTSRGSASTSG